MNTVPPWSRNASSPMPGRWARSLFAKAIGSLRVSQQPKLADGPPMPGINVVDKSNFTAIQAIDGDAPALQIVWTDSQGRLPWQAGYANPPGSQRPLGTST